MMENSGKQKEFNRFREGMRDYYNFRREAPIQAFINSIALPYTIEDLLFFIKTDNRLPSATLVLLQSRVDAVHPRVVSIINVQNGVNHLL